MPMTRIIVAALCGAAAVSAHGHIKGATTPDGTFHQGWDPDDGMGYNNKFPSVVGWSTEVQDNSFVPKSKYNTDDIICHRGAKPAAKSISIAAGDVLTLHWSTWPESHHGPVMDYLASCDGGCSKVDKKKLEFFKISEVGAIVPGNGDKGKWGADMIAAPNFQWQVRIPKDIKGGEYVLRHEILALHQNGEPQNYPQCLSLKVTGSGGNQPKGMKATELYSDYKDFNIYQDFDKYPIPGPPMIAGAEPILKQEPVANPNPSNGNSDVTVPDVSTGGGNGIGNGNSGSNSDDKSSGQGLGSGGESAPTSTTSTDPDSSIQTDVPSETPGSNIPQGEPAPGTATSEVAAPEAALPEDVPKSNITETGLPETDIPEPTDTTSPEPTSGAGAEGFPADESSAVPPAAPMETGMPSIEDGSGASTGGKPPCKNKNKNKGGFHMGNGQSNGHHPGNGGVGGGMWRHPRRAHPRDLAL